MIPSTCHLQKESKHFGPVLFEKRGGLAVLLHRRVGLLPQLWPLLPHHDPEQVVLEPFRHRGKVDQGQLALEARWEGNSLPFRSEVEAEGRIVHHVVFADLNKGLSLC